MFTGFSEKTVDFMWGIRFNNNKEWFEQHKDEYKEYLEAPMKALGADVAERYLKKHKEPEMRMHVCRIYRDARRLHGSDPYKDHLWFTLREYEEEWTDKPVFWFELMPDCWTFGLGYYMAKPLTMAKLRRRIDLGAPELVGLDKKLAGQSEFILEGEDYARAKCPPDAPLAQWYNKRSFSLIHEEKLTEELYSPALTERLFKGFDFLTPYYAYLSSLEADIAPGDVK